MPDGAGPPTEADYAWVEGWEAYCVAFVEARVPEVVLDKMVDAPGTPFISVPDAREWALAQTVPGGRSAIQARRIGDWVVTAELNGYQATLPEIVRRISKASRAIVVFRDIHAHTSFLYAIDGVVIRTFDPLVYDDPTPWDGPPLPEESDFDFGSGHPMAAAFAVAECLTGVRLTPKLLEGTGGGRERAGMHDPRSWRSEGHTRRPSGLRGEWVARGHYPFRSRPDSWDVEATNAHRQALRENSKLSSMWNPTITTPQAVGMGIFLMFFLLFALADRNWGGAIGVGIPTTAVAIGLWERWRYPDCFDSSGRLREDGCSFCDGGDPAGVHCIDDDRSGIRAHHSDDTK